MASARALRVVLALGVSLALAGVAHAACGDGVVQVGEACDASAPAGDAACPGRCVPSGQSGQCTCAAPPSDGRRYAVVAATHLRLARRANVGFGHVAVTKPTGVALIGREAIVASGSSVVADQVRIQNAAQVGRVFANSVFVQPSAALTSGGPFAVLLPLALSPLPPAPPGADAPGAPLNVPAGDTQALAPGSYGTVTVGTGATLVLRGLSQGGAGVYSMSALSVMPSARLIAANPVVVSVAGQLALSSVGSSGAFLGPAGPSHLVAGDVQIAAGKSVRLGAAVQASAEITAPTIRVGTGAVFSGQLRGDKISLGRNAAVFLEGGCGDGMLDTGEECDTSAPNGDAACPGACIPGDPQGLGRLTAGQPGQCTCQCLSDADCDDANECNGHETCQNHVCVLGLTPNCNDHNPCTRDCDPAIGCVNSPLPNGTSCSDGNPCTASDSCQDGACTAGPPVTDGTACSDGSRCTLVDSCKGGACVPGAMLDCSDDNTCSVDACDPAAGCTHTLLADGTACNDSNVCTLVDECLSGACIGTQPRNCDDGNPCTSDSCDPAAGCHHATLPDGTSCATGKTCKQGVCS
jgi:hypothetical protein